MMTMENELTPDTVQDMGRLGEIKQVVPEKKWNILRAMLSAYASGMKAGMEIERMEKGQTA